MKLSHIAIVAVVILCSSLWVMLTHSLFNSPTIKEDAGITEKDETFQG